MAKNISGATRPLLIFFREYGSCYFLVVICSLFGVPAPNFAAKDSYFASESNNSIVFRPKISIFIKNKLKLRRKYTLNFSGKMSQNLSARVFRQKRRLFGVRLFRHTTVTEFTNGPDDDRASTIDPGREKYSVWLYTTNNKYNI